jgi:hypothetical protein
MIISLSAEAFMTSSNIFNNLRPSPPESRSASVSLNSIFLEAKKESVLKRVAKGTQIFFCKGV